MSTYLNMGSLQKTEPIQVQTQQIKSNKVKSLNYIASKIIALIMEQCENEIKDNYSENNGLQVDDKGKTCPSLREKCLHVKILQSGLRCSRILDCFAHVLFWFYDTRLKTTLMHVTHQSKIVQIYLLNCDLPRRPTPPSGY